MGTSIPRILATTLMSALLLTTVGCDNGLSGASSGSSTDGSSVSPPAPNRAPTISGTPAPSVTVGQAYAFQPSASDPDGQAIAFSISGKPAWAAFNNSTGRLSGTPAAAHTGTYANIVISASDGAANATLPAFTITVASAPAPAPSTGSATLSWRAPTQNEDGTALTNLAGYRVRYGKSAGALNSLRDITNPATTTVTIPGLTAGTWYFTLSAYTNTGIESDPTAPVSKSIG
jgi:hypothetical protein